MSNQSNKKVSLADHVYSQVKHDILNGILRPKEILKETIIAKKLDTSRTPVREALRRLETEGLVTFKTQSAEVSSFTRELMYNLFQCNAVLEGLAAKEAAQNITDDQLDLLEETLYLSEKYLEKEEFDKITEKNTLFHETITEGSQNQVLLQLMSTIQPQVLAYRSFISAYKFRPTFIQGHWNIFHAIKAKDSELAESLMKAHIILDFEVINKQLGKYFDQK